MGAQSSQLKAPKIKKLTYFGLRAAGLPAQICLEIGGLPYEGRSVQFAEWGEIKPTTPCGSLPIATLDDGTVMVESGAIMRVAAANANLMGTGKDFVVSEMLLGLNGDLIKCTYGSGKVPTVLSVKDFDDKKKTEFESETKPAVAAQLGKYEQFLLPAGDRFTESGQTLGEIHLFCQLHMLSNGALPEVIQGKLASFYSRMASIPGIKKVLDGQSVMGELAHYLVPLP